MLFECLIIHRNQFFEVPMKKVFLSTLFFYIYFVTFYNLYKKLSIFLVFYFNIRCYKIKISFTVFFFAITIVFVNNNHQINTFSTTPFYNIWIFLLRGNCHKKIIDDFAPWNCIAPPDGNRFKNKVVNIFLHFVNIQYERYA